MKGIYLKNRSSLFGPVSPLGGSNFDLKATADDKKQACMGSAPAEFLHTIFTLMTDFT